MFFSFLESHLSLISGMPFPCGFSSSPGPSPPPALKHAYPQVSHLALPHDSLMPTSHAPHHGEHHLPRISRGLCLLEVLLCLCSAFSPTLKWSPSASNSSLVPSLLLISLSLYPLSSLRSRPPPWSSQTTAVTFSLVSALPSPNPLSEMQKDISRTKIYDTQGPDRSGYSLSLKLQVSNSWLIPLISPESTSPTSRAPAQHCPCFWLETLPKCSKRPPRLTDLCSC